MSIKKIQTAMLIDDDKVDQMMYKRVIQRSGLVEAAVSFTNGPDALAYLRCPEHPKVNVIFLDINMPVMSGFEFLDAAIDEFDLDFTDIVVTMLTTSLNQEDVRRAESYGVIKSYFDKPLKQEHLHQVLQILQNHPSSDVDKPERDGV